ncbi:hypothetical protein AVEN_136137-1 [Araneus ventricosus]|uniref:Uncharacterized protein n=1 Tax=Araneus ventricosus TaxID=182803 RepID=A0A4Y2RW53_ARAVE|nr:hypothetical protein AVEN_136137-1 [Araneus ventricosus]
MTGDERCDPEGFTGVQRDFRPFNPSLAQNLKCSKNNWKCGRDEFPPIIIVKCNQIPYSRLGTIGQKPRERILPRWKLLQSAPSKSKLPCPRRPSTLHYLANVWSWRVLTPETIGGETRSCLQMSFRQTCDAGGNHVCAGVPGPVSL